MPDLTWKPGPPPLDKPGEYDTLVRTEKGEIIRIAFRVRIEPDPDYYARNGWPIHDIVPYLVKRFDGGPSSTRPDNILWHFGPIPSPPTGERE